MKRVHKKVKVLVVGLSRLSKRFCESFANDKNLLEIVGVTGVNPHSRFAEELSVYDIPCYEKMEDAIQRLGSKVDVILDTSADHSLQKVADGLLAKTHNHHTVTTSIEDYLNSPEVVH